MEITIILNQSEFIIATIIPPIITSFYFGIKFYLNKERRK